MRIKMNGNAEEFFDLLDCNTPKREFTVTATVEEFNKMFEDYRRACGDGAKTLILNDNQIFTFGTVTELQTDCYPLLLTLRNGAKSEITVAVAKPLSDEVEHRVKVGDVLKIWAAMKPKYRNGDFYYDVRLVKYKPAGEDFCD